MPFFWNNEKSFAAVGGEAGAPIGIIGKKDATPESNIPEPEFKKFKLNSENSVQDNIDFSENNPTSEGSSDFLLSPDDLEISLDKFIEKLSNLHPDFDVVIKNKDKINISASTIKSSGENVFAAFVVTNEKNKALVLFNPSSGIEKPQIIKILNEKHVGELINSFNAIKFNVSVDKRPEVLSEIMSNYEEIQKNELPNFESARIILKYLPLKGTQVTSLKGYNFALGIVNSEGKKDEVKTEEISKFLDEFIRDLLNRAPDDKREEIKNRLLNIIKSGFNNIKELNINYIIDLVR